MTHCVCVCVNVEFRTSVFYGLRANLRRNDTRNADGQNGYLYLVHVVGKSVVHVHKMTIVFFFLYSRQTCLTLIIIFCHFCAWSIEFLV